MEAEEAALSTLSTDPDVGDEVVEVVAVVVVVAAAAAAVLAALAGPSVGGAVDVAVSLIGGVVVVDSEGGVAGCSAEEGAMFFTSVLWHTGNGEQFATQAFV